MYIRLNIGAFIQKSPQSLLLTNVSSYTILDIVKAIRQKTFVAFTGEMLLHISGNNMKTSK